MLQYAKWYKSIYEMPMDSRPDTAVIEDDAALDRWFEQHTREVARKAGKQGDPRYSFLGDAAVQNAVPEFGG